MNMLESNSYLLPSPNLDTLMFSSSQLLDPPPSTWELKPKKLILEPAHSLGSHIYHQLLLALASNINLGYFHVFLLHCNYLNQSHFHLLFGAVDSTAIDQYPFP